MGYLLRQGNVAVVVPLEERRYRVIASTNDALAALPVPMPVSRVRREGTFTIPIRQASVYQSGRVFLAGDAAHLLGPGRAHAGRPASVRCSKLRTASGWRR